MSCPVILVWHSSHLVGGEAWSGQKLELRVDVFIDSSLSIGENGKAFRVAFALSAFGFQEANLALQGMGLDQALPKRGPVPNNVARMYDGPPGPAKAMLQKPRVHRICSLLWILSSPSLRFQCSLHQ